MATQQIPKSSDPNAIVRLIDCTGTCGKYGVIVQLIPRPDGLAPFVQLSTSKDDLISAKGNLTGTNPNGDTSQNPSEGLLLQSTFIWLVLNPFSDALYAICNDPANYSFVNVQRFERGK